MRMRETDVCRQYIVWPAKVRMDAPARTRMGGIKRECSVSRRDGRGRLWIRDMNIAGKEIA